MHFSKSQQFSLKQLGHFLKPRTRETELFNALNWPSLFFFHFKKIHAYWEHEWKGPVHNFALTPPELNSHLGLSQHDSGMRQKEWFPQPRIRNGCPWIQLLLLPLVPGAQAESKELLLGLCSYCWNQNQMQFWDPPDNKALALLDLVMYS